MADEVIALLEAFDVEYMRNPEPKIQLIAVLEEQELVRRRLSTSDRRVTFVETTAAGRRTHDRLRRRRGRILSDALATLTPEQITERFAAYSQRYL